MSKGPRPGEMLNKKQASRLRQILITSVGLLLLYVFLVTPEASLDSSKTILDTFPDGPGRRPRHPKALLDNRFLTAEQCAAAFPGLTKEIDDAVAKGPFVLERTSELGPLIARIKDGKLTILQHTSRADLSRDMLAHRAATLHQINAALLTSPSPREIPADTILAFNHHDDPSASTLSYSRPADPSRNAAARHYFPVPHFSHWSWPLPFVGSLPRAASAIAALEARLLQQNPKGSSSSPSSSWWDSKTPKAIWRGTPHFNSPTTPSSGRLRQDLLLATRGKPWADIEALDWQSGSGSGSGPAAGGSGRNASNALPIEDFCRYRYIVHTEGITYSGRFQFHQLCASVVLSPPLAWMQTTTHLARPVFSSRLPGVQRTARDGQEVGVGGVVREKVGPLAAYPAPWVAGAWGSGYAAEEANMVFVAPDWSDLESTILWLEKHPKVAEGIARRQRELFHGGGYLSPAAEMCYWRAALSGWSKVVRYEGQGFEEMGEGMSWEEFSLTEVHR